MEHEEPRMPTPADAGARSRRHGPRRPARRACALLATVVALAVPLAACRDGDPPEARPGITTTTAPPGSPSAADPGEVLEIGVALPLSGPRGEIGRGLRDSAELAVRHANADNRVPGVTLRIVTADTGRTDDDAAHAIARLADRDRLVAVVGTVPVGAIGEVRTTLAEDNLALLSPVDTDPALTLGPAAASGNRPIPSYFRLSAHGLDLVPFASDYVLRDLGGGRVALVGDGTLDATTTLDQFAARLDAGGAAVATRLVLSTPDAVPVAVEAIRAAGASTVVWEGASALGVALAGGLTPAAPGQAPSVVAGGGGDRSCSPGATTPFPDGVLCVAPVAPAESLPSAQAFAEDYEAAGFAEPPGVAGPLTYDAVSAVVDALAPTVAVGTTPLAGLRTRLTIAIGTGLLAGATGTLSFDAAGDRIEPVLTVLRAERGAWVSVISRTSAG
jgi:ABC-type branched-subunit amino acid transport system substrate-binding protein